MVLIVCGHSQFWVKWDQTPLVAHAFRFGLATVTRFTIPFFLILSGYFIGGKIIKYRDRAVAIALSYTMKIFCLHMLWGGIYTIYLILTKHGYAFENAQAVYLAWLSYMKVHPARFFMGGPQIHLWFLSALFLIIWSFILFTISGRSREFLYFGVVLYLLGLIFGPYKILPFGIDINNKPEYYFVFAVLFFAVGVELRNKSVRISNLSALFIACIGFVVYCFEVYLRWCCFEADPFKNDFLIGMIPFGIGVFLFALNRPHSNFDNLLGPYGKFVLGIYLMHILFIDIFSPLGSYFQPLLWQLLLPAFSFTCSLLTTIILSKTKLRYAVGIGYDQLNSLSNREK
jgi:surface polysaccharide O-acyltransferase-like enzyme